MLMHLSDAYFFVNELTKTQGTSEAEADLYIQWHQQRQRGDQRYGRLSVFALSLPYCYLMFKYSGMVWKCALFYGFYCSFQAQYDMGMYLNFFIHGPKLMRKIMALDQDESFSPI